MAEVKLTKSELKDQRQKLTQLERYLPTLQLKKALLQAEVVTARALRDSLEKDWQLSFKQLHKQCQLINLEPTLRLEHLIVETKIEKTIENIAGAELPLLQGVTFQEAPLNLFDSPPWADALIELLKTAKTKKCGLDIAKERVQILENELSEVSVRVNLFEKVLIPTCKEHIKKIKIFLGDMELAAVAQAKVAKRKIIEQGY